MPDMKLPALPQSVDPAQASVFDPLYKQLIRQAVSAMGLGDPMTAATSVMNPMATPLVAKLPFDVLRQRGPELIKQAKANGLSREVVRALDFAQQKYPRVFGHMKSIGELETTGVKGWLNRPMSDSNALIERTRYGRNPWSPRLKFSSPHMANPYIDTPDVVGHELNHVAQGIIQPKMGQNYRDETNKIRETFNKQGFSPESAERAAYWTNKYEVGSRKAGKKFSDRYWTDLKWEPQELPPDKPSLYQTIMSKLGLK